ncbi:dTDP-glucose 4,6-dehydratase 2 [Photobacterium damselae]|uniref:dTDP-glucose 4,6-dehydratase 2 n=1 Tax=Photobacterium damselae TaxID=38293 RepID=A0A2X1WDF3_PHODM|nr:dTDP-glucose 4,6-dehydratase 2 [Photobacterium damselae]
MQNDVSAVAINKTAVFDSGFFVPNKPVSITFYKDLITHISYRSGYDIRYAIDATKN